MSSRSVLLVTGPIQDGYILPVDTCAYTRLTIGTTSTVQLVFSIDNVAVNTLTVSNPSLLDLSASSTVHIERASNVAIRLINPANPKHLDLLLLVKDNTVGIYQYLSNVWTLISTALFAKLPTSIVSSKSVGIRTNLPFVGGICKVVEVSDVPQVMLPYTIYVDKPNSLIYFPYFNAVTYQYPLTVASIWSASIAALLYEEQLVVISPCGFKQQESLPLSMEYVYLTYSSLLTASIHQPIAYHSATRQVVVSTVITPTNNQVDYSAIQGLSSAEYQLTNGYYRGGNNLWTDVISQNGVIDKGYLLEIVPTSTYTSALVNLQVSQIHVNGNRLLDVYVGKKESLSAGNIMYRLRLVPFTTNSVKNIRLAAGESIHVKLNAPTLLHYRYTMLARTI